MTEQPNDVQAAIDYFPEPEEPETYPVLVTVYGRVLARRVEELEAENASLKREIQAAGSGDFDWSVLKRLDDLEKLESDLAVMTDRYEIAKERENTAEAHAKEAVQKDMAAVRAENASLNEECRELTKRRIELEAAYEKLKAGMQLGSEWEDMFTQLASAERVIDYASQTSPVIASKANEYREKYPKQLDAT